MLIGSMTTRSRVQMHPYETLFTNKSTFLKGKINKYSWKHPYVEYSRSEKKEWGRDIFQEKSMQFNHLKNSVLEHGQLSPGSELPLLFQSIFLIAKHLGKMYTHLGPADPMFHARVVFCGSSSLAGGLWTPFGWLVWWHYELSNLLSHLLFLQNCHYSLFNMGLDLPHSLGW